MSEGDIKQEVDTVVGDVEMKDGTTAEPALEVAQQSDITDPNPAPQPQSESQPASDLAAPELAPPVRPPESTPPVASGGVARPVPMPSQLLARPEKAVAHGGPTRQYLNQNVTPHLLEGMKYLAAYEPEKPLQWLADFLRERSKEVER